MSTGSEDASGIIRGLKSHFGVRSDDALSEKIGVAKSTIATWRRRKIIPRKVMDQLAEQHGLTLQTITDARRDEVRDYVLRQCRYHIVLSGSNALFSEDGYENNIQALADDLAVIEPYLDKQLVKASSGEASKGLSGAVKLLMSLRTGEFNFSSLMQEAKAERKRDLGD